MQLLVQYMYLFSVSDVLGISCVYFRDKSAAEKRRQLIQESKFLGGDMEHTHLVKGLDFALLQKVKHKYYYFIFSPTVKTAWSVCWSLYLVFLTCAFSGES